MWEEKEKVSGVVGEGKNREEKGEIKERKKKRKINK